MGGHEIGRYHIRPIPLCRGIRDRSQWTYRIGYGEKTATCNYLWYIEGGGQGVLVDTGARAEQFRKRGLGDEDIQSLEKGLQTVGIDFEDVKTVILTHLHWDHVSFAAKFSKAVFFIQRKEFDFALNPHPAVASQYNREFLGNLKIELIEGDKDIIDGIKVIFTPGHTPGGQSVAVDTTEGLAIITGFCCSLENFFPTPAAKAKGLNIVAPGIHTDLLQAYDSVLRVKQMAKIIVPLHDPTFVGMDRIPGKIKCIREINSDSQQQ
jgi:N-acyl homoserine lactone hydrolase